MEQGGKRKHKKGGSGDGRRPGRRTPPPAGTGLEARYLQQVLDAGDSLELSLADGRTVHGPLEGFDQNVITIRVDEQQLVVRKSEIRFLREAD